LAVVATLLVIGAILFFMNRTSHAPDKDSGEPHTQTTAVSNGKGAFGVIDEIKVIDLTYEFSDKTIYWPTAKPFEWEKESWGKSAGGYWYTAARYAASEHGGTHLDAPIHFGEGKQAADEIPVSRLVGPAIVIDISQACANNADYRLTTDDIAAWEKAHGVIPNDSIVLVRTGWGKFWPDKK